VNTGKYVGLTYDDLNCWGLVKAIYLDELGIDLPDIPIQMDERGNWVEVELEHELDLLLFDTVDGPHVGLCIGEGRMIHSDKHNGVVIERYKRDVWKSRLQAIYRHR